MSNLERYLANAHRCRLLADRYAGSQTELTLVQAAEAWMLLVRLEEVRDEPLPREWSPRSTAPCPATSARPGLPSSAPPMTSRASGASALQADVERAIP